MIRTLVTAGLIVAGVCSPASAQDSSRSIKSPRDSATGQACGFHRTSLNFTKISWSTVSAEAVAGAGPGGGPRVLAVIDLGTGPDGEGAALHAINTKGAGANSRGAGAGDACSDNGSSVEASSCSVDPSSGTITFALLLPAVQKRGDSTARGAPPASWEVSLVPRGGAAAEPASVVVSCDSPGGAAAKGQKGGWDLKAATKG